jgi:aminoglycoside phosphotransferase family enzyme/predicted kinase
VNSSGFQQQLIAFLQSPASYPHQPAEVRMVQTHISWVFIASPFVFKVKKPVNLGFLDFSRLKERRYFCQRELDLNRRLCPEIYLGVVPIYRTASGFSFEPQGEIAEYAVKMRELPRGGFLSERLDKGLVGETEIHRVIATLRRFYESQTPSAEIAGRGAPENLKINTDENFTQAEPFVGKTISRTAFEAIRHYTNRFYLANEGLFHERIQQHRILDCHGDLHLDHVHLTPEAITIFDCIEFNDRFRFIDVASDLAFLAMDFDFHGRSDLANLLLQTAAREFNDPGMLRIGDFYKCYRAFVRGKVESIQASEPETTDPVEHVKKAARYFRLALRYAIAGSEPLVLAVMGRVGAGKSTVARELGNELGWLVFSSDEIRKTLAGIPLTQRTPEQWRDQVYSPQMTARTYEKLIKDGLGALQQNRGVILDATFATRKLRQLLRDESKKAHARLQFVELDADPEEIKKRLKSRDHSGGEISDARLEDFEKLTATYEPPRELEPHLIRVSANEAVGDVLKAVLLKLAEQQTELGAHQC